MEIWNSGGRKQGVFARAFARWQQDWTLIVLALGLAILLEVLSRQ